MSYVDGGFVVCPDRKGPHAGPHRVFRYQPADFFPAADIVTYWEVEANILHINRSMFDQLEKYDQAAALRTRQRYTYATK